MENQISARSESTSGLATRQDENGKIKVIVVGPNGGGVRKTKTSLLCGSIAAAAGHKVLYVCADRGIGSLSISLKVGGPNDVELFPEQESASYADTLVKMARGLGAGVVIIDLGANEMLNSASRRTLRRALADLKASGHETYVVLSLVAAKAGLEDDASNFASKMEKVASVVLAIHGRDEGGDLAHFDELLQDYRSFDVQSDEAAILNLVTAAGVTHYEWCSSPPLGFEMAGALMADNLLKLARQPMMADMLGSSVAVPALAELARNRPATYYRGRNKKADVRNETLAADAAHIAADRALTRLAPDAEETSVIAAARRYIQASLDRHRAHQAAKHLA